MPGYLKLTPEFSQKAVIEYLTSSRVVTEKPCYLFASLVAPHAFSVDCQARLRNGETVNADILLNCKTQYEHCMHAYSPPIYFNRGLYVELVGEILLLLDDCGDTSTIADWAEFDDALDPVDETTLVKEGSHSMKMEVDADRTGADDAYWQNTQSQGDLSAYQNDWLYLWVYLTTVDYLHATNPCLRVFIGNDAGNYLLFTILKAELAVGWNLIKCDLDNPDASLGTVDWLDISYLIFQLIMVTGNTNDFIVYVDSIMFVRPFSGATDGITEGATVQYLIE